MRPCRTIVYLIAGDGWKKAAQPQLIIDDKNRKTKAKPDFALGKKKYTAELIPPALVIARYYAKEQAAIEELEGEARCAIAQEMEEFIEEKHWRRRNGKKDEHWRRPATRTLKSSKPRASVAVRLKEIKKDPDSRQ